jgi:hypothetical protein
MLLILPNDVPKKKLNELNASCISTNLLPAGPVTRALPLIEISKSHLLSANKRNAVARGESKDRHSSRRAKKNAVSPRRALQPLSASTGL